MDTQSDLQARLTSLERKTRLIVSIGSVTALILVVALVLLFVRTDGHGTLSANEFQLRDRSGHTLARLSSDASGACFEVLGKNHLGKVSLCAGDEMGSSLVLDNAREGARVTLTAGMLLREGPGSLDPGLAISQTNARTVATIFLYKGAHLSLEGPSGEDSVQLSSVQAVASKPRSGRANGRASR